MRILSIDMRNFMSHIRTVFEIPDGFIGVLGHNGSGKSSLIRDSVTWALWGKSRVGGAGDDVITTGRDFTRVSVRVKSGDNLYSITRVRTLGDKTQLILEHLNGHKSTDLSGPTLRHTQDLINNHIGMDYNIFRNTCCVEQGESDSFSNLTPKEAGQIILKILQLDSYSGAQRGARLKLSEIRAEIDKLTLSNEHLEEKESDFEVVRQLIETKRNELVSAETEYERVNSSYSNDEKVYNGTYEKWQKISTKLGILKSKSSDYDEQLVSLDSRSALLKDESTACPVCDSKLTNEKRALVRRRMLEEYQDIVDKKSKVDTDIQNLTKEGQELYEKLRKFQLRATRESIKTLHSRVESLKAEISSLGGQTTTSDDVRGTIQKNVLLLSDARQREAIYSTLDEAFGPKGIPLLIVDNVLRELEVSINNVLGLLSDLPISVELKTQREGSDGEYLDTFQILIHNGSATRHYFNYSGGERLIIDLSIRLGLSELLARRNNFRVESLIIDEGLASLDEQNQHKLIRTLQKLSSKFSSILLVTHAQAKDYLKNYVELSNDGEKSVLDKRGNIWHNTGVELLKEDS